MERPLNIENGWEEIINDDNRQKRIDEFYAKRYQNKVDKLSAKAFVFSIAAAVLLVLGLTGAMTGWIAFPVYAVLAGVSCFRFGQLYQLGK